MQNRAVILSMGMLLKKVDFSPLIDFLEKQIAQDNPALNKAEIAKLKMQGLMVAAKFNLTKPSVRSATDDLQDPVEEFRKELFKQTKITSLTSDEFWKQWSECIKVGDLDAQVKALQEVAHKHQCTFYVCSDTNMVDEAHIASECKSYQTAGEMPVLQDMPVYTSHRTGFTREKLVAHVIEKIQAKEFKQIPLVILGHHENIVDALQKMQEKMKNDAVKKLAENKGVCVLEQRLPDTWKEVLEKHFTVRPVVEEIISATMMRMP